MDLDVDPRTSGRPRWRCWWPWHSSAPAVLGRAATRSGTDENGTDPVQDGIRIQVESSQPDRVSGPDARIRVTPPKDGDPSDLQVTLGDVDVTGQLVERDGGLEGVVNGLIEGTNTLSATDGPASTTQRIRSWPLAGPMISGPHLPLLACSTEEHGLGAPLDADCAAPTVVTWRYVSTDGTIKALAEPDARPADLATGRVDGKDGVPLLVRYEIGVVNRSIYEIASLDPSPGGSDSSQEDAAWNGRLLYRFGDGCGTTFGQGTSNVAALDPGYLKAGYALATATFNTGAVQCNDVLSAETTMMVKERFIEEFGVPVLTLGEGSGGGAAQVHLLVQNYPGLIDGAVALDPLPDVVTVATTVADCRVLQGYFATTAGAALTPAQRAAIDGEAIDKTCSTWATGYGGLFDPTDGCDPKIKPEQVYAEGTNPGGVRCTLADANVNQFGRDEATAQANRPLDNVGVQYGLAALNAKTITFDQFIALNRAVGGLDADGRPQAERTEASVAAVQAAYENGRVSTGVGDQDKVPLIEVDRYDDPAGSTTERYRAFSLRDRLTRGGPDEAVPNLQIWTRDAPDPTAGPKAVATLDAWLTELIADRGGSGQGESLLRSRPKEAVDNCIPPGAAAPTAGVGIYDKAGPCRDRYPISGSPRTAAGAPRSDDVIKCQLKPVDPEEYEVQITQAQLTKLEETFPSGVCEWRAPGVGQTSPSMSDRTYEDADSPGALA